MQVKLDAVDFQEVFTAAILQSLDEGKKEELIKGALTFLLNKSSDSYSKKSPLQDAFETALRAETITFAREYISKDETLKESIQGLIQESVLKITTDAREKTVDKIAEKIIEGLYSDKY